VPDEGRSDRARREHSEWVEPRVEVDGSRFAVWIDVYLVDGHGRPTRLESRRIADYPNERLARVAAEWMRRGAQRGDPFPPERRDEPRG
jgi:hypothetical protein